MNLTCWMFGHKWEDAVRIFAKNGKWGSGKVVVRKCERCGKTDVHYEACIEPKFPCEIEIASPSITRKLTEEASIEIEGKHTLDAPLEMSPADETSTSKETTKKVSKSTSRDKS